jgi:hypothetical protein
MPDISTINGVAIASVAEVNSVAVANISTIMGITKASAASTVYDWDFNSTTGTSNASAATLPSGWAKADSGNMTVYGSTTDTDIAGYQSTRGWVFTDGEGTSTLTGVGGGMAGGVDATDGAWDATSAAGNTSFRYMLLECSSIKNKPLMMMRTNELDFSSYSTITLHMWIHLYGSAITRFGVACTTDASSASSAVEAGSNLGFTGDDTGGCTIQYDSNGDGTLDGSTVRFTSQINTDGDQYNESQTAARKWRKATIDLSAAAGESSVYIYFLGGTNNVSTYYRGDVSVDSIKIVAG